LGDGRFIGVKGDIEILTGNKKDDRVILEDGATWVT
jgi:hypothetical protein